MTTRSNHSSFNCCKELHTGEKQEEHSTHDELKQINSDCTIMQRILTIGCLLFCFLYLILPLICMSSSSLVLFLLFPLAVLSSPSLLASVTSIACCIGSDCTPFISSSPTRTARQQQHREKEQHSDRDSSSSLHWKNSATNRTRLNEAKFCLLTFSLSALLVFFSFFFLLSFFVLCVPRISSHRIC